MGKPDTGRFVRQNITFCLLDFHAEFSKGKMSTRKTNLRYKDYIFSSHFCRSNLVNIFIFYILYVFICIIYFYAFYIY